MKIVKKVIFTLWFTLFSTIVFWFNSQFNFQGIMYDDKGLILLLTSPVKWILSYLPINITMTIDHSIVRIMNIVVWFLIGMIIDLVRNRGSNTKLWVRFDSFGTLVLYIIQIVFVLLSGFGIISIIYRILHLFLMKAL